VFTKILLFLLFEALGVAMITYREKIVRMIGKNDYAEKYLGAGGTYNMWSIIGMITMFVGLMILMGKFSF